MGSDDEYDDDLESSEDGSEYQDDAPEHNGAVGKGLNDSPEKDKGATTETDETKVGTNENSQNISIKIDKGAIFENMNSPLILPIAILLYSAFQKNTSGIPYMFFLIIFVFLRSNLFKYQKKNISDRCSYNLPLFGKTLNINVFVSIFSLAYILLPMIIFTQFNIASIIILIVYTFTNLGLFLYEGCYKIKSILVGDVFFSIVSGVVSILIIMAFNSSLNLGNKNFLFIDNTGSSKEICSMPTKQNFKCNVWQNGQLVTQTSNIPNS